MKQRLSLKARGMQLLAQRDHSRHELRRKLMAYVLAAAPAGSPTPGTSTADRAGAEPNSTLVPVFGQVLPDGAEEPCFHTELGTAMAMPDMAACGDPPAEAPPVFSDAGAAQAMTEAEAAEAVDATLDWLQSHRYLNEARFVESRVHARVSKFGNLRIRQELAQHGVSVAPELGQQLKDSEFDRAIEVWLKKFGQPAQGLAERAKQMRFLAGRGFSSEVIRRVVSGAGGQSLDDGE